MTSSEHTADSGSQPQYPVPLRRSLYVRMAASFLGIVAVVGLVQIYLTGQVYRQLVAQIEQQVSWNLAADLAERLRPALADGFKRARVERELFRYIFMNPKVEAYVLDSSGAIIADVAPYGTPLTVDRVPLGPVRRILSAEAPLVPIFGRDPRANAEAADGFNRAISVAPLDLGGEQGFLYLVLEAGTFRWLTRATGQLYIAATVLGGLVVVLLLASVVGMLVFLYLTRNFRLLTAAVGEYRDGNFEVRVPVSVDDEVGRLAGAVNEMIGTISRQTEELKNNDRLRRELIANISHDLRSPLTAMQGFLETMHRKKDSATPAEREQYLGLIGESVRLQRQLVEDLFELSKLEAREREPHLEGTHPGELAQDVLMKYKAAAESKNLSLGLKIPEDCPLVSVDIVLIDRALSNLVSNAVRYTPDGGSIEVSLHCDSGGCEVRVSDTGPGIPEDELPFIFDSFYRVHKDRNRKTGGSGLGLAIVKRIVELHGSVVGVRSSEQGTAFWFGLPVLNSSADKQGEELGVSEPVLP